VVDLRPSNGWTANQHRIASAGVKIKQYIIRRVLLTVPVLWAVTLVLFVLIRITPGDPVLIEFGLEASQDQLEARREELGLNRPLPIQYVDWLQRMLQGDFGKSLRERRPVADMIWERLPATLELQGLALVLAVMIAVPLGTLSALKPKSLLAKTITASTLASIAVPGFFFGTVLIFLFTYKLRLFETPRYVPFTEDPLTNLSNLVLPVIVLSHVPVAIYTRFIRASVLEALGQDYIRTARAKGLDELRLVTRHALRNALIPIVTFIGLSLGGLWTGAFIIERIFNWPGIGRLATTALLNKDYPIAQAIVFISIITFALANLLVDILYAVLDPRIHHGNRR
jgi:peptide/nickel transport system permease protein